jgi:hypothetical protein
MESVGRQPEQLARRHQQYQLFPDKSKIPATIEPVLAEQSLVA